MSGAAKALVVINLVLALFFASATAMNLALRTDLKQQFDDLQATYDQDMRKANDQISQLEQTSDNLTNQRDALSNDKAVLENRLKDTEAKLTLERQNRMGLDARLTSLDSSYSELKRQYERLATRNEALAQELAAAKKTAEDSLAAMELAVDKRREAEAQAEALQGQFRSLAKQLKEVSDDLARYRAIYPEPGGRPTPANIFGKVKQVDLRYGLVVISVGEDDGVKAGMEFTVYRGDGYVGKVVVEDVDKDDAVARVDSAVSEEVKVGDNVSAAF